MKDFQVLIIDLGSQYTQLIARELLALGYRNVVVQPEQAGFYTRNSLKAVILSGGDASVYDDQAPTVPEEVFSFGCPILGICYGMQLIVSRLDPNLVKGDDATSREYGPTMIRVEDSRLFAGLPEKTRVWASHGDTVVGLPIGFSEIASSSSGSIIQAIEHPAKRIYGVQFHPEVKETEEGGQILSNFMEICGCQRDWEAEDTILEIRSDVLNEIGEGRAALGVSGGVDSTTLAAILSPVLKERLVCFLIDTGALRWGEAEEVKAVCDAHQIKLKVIDAGQRFFEALAETVDAEKKRKLFQEVYKSIFKEIIRDNGITHILQGTLATDLIESGHHGKAAKIKSHHNVGLKFEIAQLHPFKKLFKHQVREVSRQLGLSEAISERKPFPGPGLFIRIVGTPVTPELIERLREADYLVNNILQDETIYPEISQIVVGLLGVNTVGIQGDKRTYTYPLVIRCVASTDFMTVKGVSLPGHIREKIISEVTRHGFNRVLFDETPKPPATTELE